MIDYEAAVRDYLKYCRVARAELKLAGSQLDPKNRPTEAGACKLIYGDAKAIREAYVKVTSGSDEKGAAA